MGDAAYDTICLSNSKCNKNFSFLSVTDVALMSWMKSSGIIGASFSNIKNKDADLLILKLKENQYIKKAVFSIFVDHKYKNSKLILGGYNLNKYSL